MTYSANEATSESWRSLIVGPGRGEPGYTVWGELVTILVGEARAGGRFTVVEMTTHPGWRRDSYVDGEVDESFYVLEGSFEVDLGDRPGTQRLEAGTLLYVPRGVMCAMRSVSEKAGRLLVFTMPRPAPA